MPNPQQKTKTTARILLALAGVGYGSGLGFLLFVIILMEQGNSISREAVVAMNDPGRLADFERKVHEVRLTTSLILFATLVVAAINVLALRTIMAALRKD